MVAINPASRRRSVSVGYVFVRLLLVCLSMAFYTGVVTRPAGEYLLLHNNNSTAVESQLANEDVSAILKSSQNNDWSHCIEDQPKAITTNSDAASISDKQLHNPLWLPAYPTSLPRTAETDWFKNFLQDLTGLPSASKLYYRSSKTLKRCHNLNIKSGFDGVTCEIVHPIVPCKRPSPSAQAENFGKAVLVGLRNPLTAFPSYHQEKAEKYHNVKGQVAKQEWIDFRDQYVGNATHSPLFQEWKAFIIEWRNMNPYHVALYLPYEEWLDETKGLELVNRFSHVLKEEGFPIQYAKDDMACIWYKHIYQAAVSENKKHVDEGWYIPEYTVQQRALLVAELRKFASEIDGTRPGDEQLKGILMRYSEEF